MKKLMVYYFRGSRHYSLLSIESMFCLKEGAGSRLLESGEIKIAYEYY